MFMKNFKLKFEQNWPKPLLITNHGQEEKIEKIAPHLFITLCCH